eukprot:TRINITY_DN2143_c0_g1_i2.p1 TRINITY_DN2143_c0_g1~~TRINITY_DN2143_c0_g1_i2.p1  ORF type:complete len:1194 (-),score=273.89 TRINITY_DN2143_c0_g1_i2:322-3903(-)
MALDGTRLWIHDATHSFVEGEVLRQQTDGSLIVRNLTSGQEITLKTMDELHFCNPEVEGGYPDMTSLNHLNEGAILHNLKQRFAVDTVYTYCGRTCIAVNPFKWLDLYNEKIITKYHETKESEYSSLDPHVFAIAETAYRDMKRTKSSQSILVSGESGAGKTETTKLLMKYLAQVAHTTGLQVTDQVLQSNPLLEAFGNAKTVRNDNSSRFGKFIELQFNTSHMIVGARIQTYLLEKSRVVHLSNLERNYHIFYQLIAGADEKLKKELHLSSLPSDYFYLNQSSCVQLDGVDDGEDLQKTIQAMKIIGIAENEINAIFRILSAILHLGQIKFGSTRRNEDSASVLNPDELNTISDLLSVSVEKLNESLCFRRISAVNETYSKPNTVEQAIIGRDALSKNLYGRVFDWLVDKINQTTRRDDQRNSFIGILDIFGFECFEKNSFEQLCINYANEKLQQQYTQDVFKTVQEEYRAEKIPWSFVDFVDNQECLNLIESKMGILALLSEECIIPKGSDASFLTKLQTMYGANKYFEKPKLANKGFSIHHFAGKVLYDVTSFLDKNKDALVPDLIASIKSSVNGFITGLMSQSFVKGPETGGKAGVKDHFLGNQFKHQLSSLMATIQSTSVNYVRCIKPNMQNKASLFTNMHVSHQLRYAGVLEAIRISRAAYPNRLHHEEFLERFLILGKNGLSRRTEADKLKYIRSILETYFEDPSMYQVGVTRIYFKYGCLEELEKERSSRLSSVVIVLQKYCRRWIQEKRYRKTRRFIIALQALIRCRRLTHRYRKMKKSAIVIQSAFRMWKAIVLRKALKKQHCALIIQKNIRGFIARKEYLRYRQMVVYVQSVLRMIKARRKYVVMLHESREAKKIENQLALMHQRLQDEINSRLALEKEKRLLEEQLRAQATPGNDDAESEEDETAQDATHEVDVQSPTVVPVVRKKVVSITRQKRVPVAKSTTNVAPEDHSGTDETTSRGILEDANAMFSVLQAELDRVQKKLENETETRVALEKTNKLLEADYRQAELRAQIEASAKKSAEARLTQVLRDRAELEDRFKKLTQELGQLKMMYRNECTEKDLIQKDMKDIALTLNAQRSENQKLAQEKSRLEEERKELRSMLKFEAQKRMDVIEKLKRTRQENDELRNMLGWTPVEQNENPEPEYVPNTVSADISSEQSSVSSIVNVLGSASSSLVKWWRG